MVFSSKPNSRVLAKTEIDLPVSGIDSDYASRAALQKTIGKAAGRGPDVETDLAGNIHLPVIKGSFQFQTTATDVLEIFAEKTNVGGVVEADPAFSIFCPSTNTLPARISACARSRDVVRPRSSRSLSSRTFN